MKAICIALIAIFAFSMVGCANMSNTEQRTLSGAAIGTAGGAVVGAIAGSAGWGAAIGAATIGLLILGPHLLQFITP